MNKLISYFNNFFLSQNRKKLFKLCVPALILVVIFAVISFIPVYFGKRASIEGGNKLIIDTAVMSINDIFKNIDDIYKNVESALDGEVIFGDGSIMSEDRQYASEIADVMAENIAVNSYLEEIVILKKNEELVLTSGGVMLKRDFFGKNYVSDVYGMNFFDNLSTDYLNVKVIPAASYKNMEKYPAEDPKSLFACVKRLDTENVNIIIFISRDRFVRAGNLAPLDSNINFKIYDNSDSLIYSNTDSEYMISTSNIPGDFSERVINLGIKKYYITKSDYNYFYYVAEVSDYLLIVLILVIILMLAGFFMALMLLMSGIRRIDEEVLPIFDELGMPPEESSIYDVTGKIKEYKKELSENSVKLDNVSDEIKNGIFLKAANSSSFYGRYKKTVDGIFYDILDDECFFILSVETVRENIKLPRYEISKIEAYYKEKGHNFVFIEEKTRKYLYVTGCKKGESLAVIEELKETIKDIRANNMEILVCYSREFESLASLYDAFRDIRICRDYRGIDDKVTIIGTDNIDYGGHIYLPPNFKEELTGKIMAKEDEETKKYIKDIFARNIERNIPLSKFEFMLRQMLTTVTDALSMNKKSSSDMYELEQVFLAGIEQLKENHDVYGIINNFINLVHLSINMYDSKKGVLNRTDVIKYINANFSQDLYLEKVATQFGTTPKYFSNYFKKEFTVGFNEYITGLRISQAKKLLSETNKTLSEISAEVGYINQATFAAAFKKLTGLPPGKYREINKTQK